MGTRSKNEYIRKALYCTAIILLLGCGTRKRQMQQNSTEIKVEAVEEGITKNDVQKILESNDWSIKLVPIDPEKTSRIGKLDFHNTTVDISNNKRIESTNDKTVAETKSNTKKETSTYEKIVAVDRDSRWGIREYIIFAAFVALIYALYRIYTSLRNKA